MKKLWIAILIFMSLTTLACGDKDVTTFETNNEDMWISNENSSEIVDTVAVTETEPTTSNIKQIVVHVCGEVKNPGVYFLNDGQRVYDAIMAAGGLTDAADESSINQAVLLEDSQQIIILAKSDNTDKSMASGYSDGKININKADITELTSLNGIGESRAKAIISYREENGQFKSIEDIMQVSGIKQSLFEKIKDQIKVS